MQLKDLYQFFVIKPLSQVPLNEVIEMIETESKFVVDNNKIKKFFSARYKTFHEKLKTIGGSYEKLYERETSKYDSWLNFPIDFEKLAREPVQKMDQESPIQLDVQLRFDHEQMVVDEPDQRPSHPAQGTKRGRPLKTYNESKDRSKRLKARKLTQATDNNLGHILKGKILFFTKIRQRGQLPLKIVSYKPFETYQCTNHS